MSLEILLNSMPVETGFKVNRKSISERDYKY